MHGCRQKINEEVCDDCSVELDQLLDGNTREIDAHRQSYGSNDEHYLSRS